VKGKDQTTVKGGTDGQEKEATPPPAILKLFAQLDGQATRATAKDGTRYTLDTRRAGGIETTTIRRSETKAERRARLKAEKRARGKGMKVNHLSIVQDEHAKQPPVSGDLLSVFAFQQRVLARLALEFPGERWGYLKKGGENTIEFEGETVKVGRVCDPSSQLYKIATDIPTTNDPIWNDDGILTVDFPGSSPDDWYLPFDGGVIDPPIDPPVDDPTIKAQLDRIEMIVNGNRAAIVNLTAMTSNQFDHQEQLIKQLSDQIAAMPGGGGTIPPEIALTLGKILTACKAARVGHTQAFGGRMTIDQQP